MTTTTASTVSEAASSASSTLVDMITEWQSKVVGMNRDFMEAVKPYVSSLPGTSLAKSMFDTSIIDRSFELSDELLKANRKFTKDLLAVWAPSDEGSASKASAAKK
jgi:hypothetical protein